MKNQIGTFLMGIVFFFFSGKSLSQSNNAVNYDSQQEIANNIARQFVEIINMGNRDSIGRFVTKAYDTNFLKNIPLSAIVTYNLAINLESGGMGYDIIQMNPVKGNSISVKVFNRLTECNITLNISTAGAPEYKINAIVVPDFMPKDTTTNKIINQEDLLKRFNICLKKIALEEEFSGVVVIAQNDNILLERPIGMANVCYNVPIQVNTKFNIASVGKMFTAVAIAQLVKEGKLSFEDTINKYIQDDWLNPKISERIQIKHLLTHTSGLGDYFRDVQKQCNIPYFRTLDDYKPLIINDTLRFNPGTQFSYSNTGLLLAGVIIENVSHESYFSFLKKNIFIPLGMNNTDGFDKDYPAPNTATGYTKVIENGVVKWNNNQYTRIMRGSPSGGIYSTAEDLIKFASAIRNNMLFPSGYQDMLMKPHPELNVPFHNYLFFNSTGQNNRQIYHSGDGQGTNCYFKMFLDSGYTYIILSNMNRPSANILADVLDQLLSKY